MSHAYTVTVAQPVQLDSLREEWNALVRRMPKPVIFATWEWVTTWWRHYRTPSRELLVLLIHHGSELKGVLPLYADSGRADRRWLVGRVLTYCSAFDLFPDHLDIIAASADRDACCAALERFFFEQYRRWDVLRFPVVADPSGLFSWIGGQAKSNRAKLEPTSSARYIALNGSFEDYFAGLDKKKRYNVRSRRKKLCDEAGFRLRTYLPAESAICLEDLFTLHEKRAQAKGIVSTFDDGTARRFHQDFINQVIEKGWVRLQSLSRESETIAGSYNFVFEGQVFSYQKGMDPAWDRHGPGSVLLYDLIQQAHAEGLHEFNFLRGDESYKAEWTDSYRTLYSGYMFNRSVAGRLSIALRRCRTVLKKILRRS